MSALAVETQESVDYIKSRIGARFVSPKAIIVCGSGLSTLADTLDDAEVINYQDIPHFKTSTVQGHASKLVFGFLDKTPVLAMVGRFHFYEGYSIKTTAYPIRTFAKMGVQVLIATNAAGGLNDAYEGKFSALYKCIANRTIVGDIAVISDHINLPGLIGQNPLMGANESDFGDRFTPLSDAYDLKLRQGLFQAAKEYNITRNIHEGVYCFVSGPTYETRAECRMLKTLGADLVGMSTVAEVVAARHSGMRVLAMSLVTNKSVLSPVPSGYDSSATEHKMTEGIANHAEVLAAGIAAAQDMQILVAGVIRQLP